MTDIKKLEEIMKENKYVLGIVGALIGGFIASIPWVMMYVYGGMILSLLAILIAVGSLFGYQKFKGTVDEKLPFIISVVSLFVVTVATLVIIPLLLLAKEGFAMTIGNLSLLYQYEEFKTSIIGDYIISIIFTFLGISGVIGNIKRQLRQTPDTISIKPFNNDINVERDMIVKEVKDAFVTLNALDKQNAVTKEEILEKMTVSNPKLEFNNLRIQQIIKKYKGKYYFSEKAASSFWNRFFSLFFKILIPLIILIIIIALF